jgi:hypothetical protein
LLPGWSNNKRGGEGMPIAALAEALFHGVKSVISRVFTEL